MSKSGMTPLEFAVYELWTMVGVLPELNRHDLSTCTNEFVDWYVSVKEMAE